MPICIECRHPVQQLYTSYSRADDRSSGKGVRLTQCPECKHFADKYVEHDFVVLFIDLVLIKPQVYRHLLFNRLEMDSDEVHPSIVRLAILLLLFDVYLTWARIERNLHRLILSGEAAFEPTGTTSSLLSKLFGGSKNAGDVLVPSPLHSYPLPLQYLFFLTLCTVETLAFHIPIRLLTATPASGLKDTISTEGERQNRRKSRWLYRDANRVSTALLVSSCTKLFPVLMVIWEYDLPSSASALSWAVIINNIAALEILLDCGYVRATGLVGVGALLKWLAGWVILSAAGLRTYGTTGVDLGLLESFAGTQNVSVTGFAKNILIEIGGFLGLA